MPEIAGPRAEDLVEMAALLAATDPVKIEGVVDPAGPDRDRYVTGALLPGPHATLAGRSGSTPPEPPHVRAALAAPSAEPDSRPETRTAASAAQPR